MSLTPKNWKEFQHYKDRSPAWIKLHRGLLNDFKFHRLPVASRALAPMLWLLASEYDDGAIPLSMEEIGFRLHLTDDELHDALKPLIDAGFFIDASGVLAACKQAASLEKEEETQDKKEEEEETRASALVASDWPADYREQFWEPYPNKVGKPAALKALDRIHKRGTVPWMVLMGGLRRYCAKQDDRPWCNPLTFLNQERWNDQPAVRPQPNLTTRDRQQQRSDDAIAKLNEFVRASRNSGGPDHRLLPEGDGERPGNLHRGPDRDSELLFAPDYRTLDERDEGSCRILQIPARAG